MIMGLAWIPMSLFVHVGTFLEQIAFSEMVSKFRTFPNCACPQTENSPRDIT